MVPLIVVTTRRIFCWLLVFFAALALGCGSSGGDGGSADAGPDDAASGASQMPPFGTYVQVGTRDVGIEALSLRPPRADGSRPFVMWERASTVIERSYRGTYTWLEPAAPGERARVELRSATADPSAPGYHVTYRWDAVARTLEVSHLDGTGMTTLAPSPEGLCAENRDCLEAGATLGTCDAGRAAWVCSLDDYFCKTTCLP